MKISPSSSFPLSEFMAGVPLSEEEKTGQGDYLAYCHGNGKTFGEYYVSLIADYFGVSWDWTVDRLHRLTIYLRAYTVVDDDVRDVPRFKHESSLRMLRQYFLEMAWIEARRLLSRDINATRIFETELDRYHLTSDLYSMWHSEGTSYPVDVSYTEKYADRMATIRIPFLLLGLQPRGERFLTRGLRGIESFMRALQVLDDLVDWEEDLREGRITYPTVCYLATLPITEAEEISRCVVRSESEDIENTIRTLSRKPPYHRIVWEQLEFAYQILNEATIDLGRGLGSSLSSMAVDIRERVDWVRSGHVISGTPCIKQDELIVRLKHSGAAPKRSHRERGTDAG